jgi:ABC-type uncharacterized transport system ATPase subunit
LFRISWKTWKTCAIVLRFYAEAGTGRRDKTALRDIQSGGDDVWQGDHAWGKRQPAETGDVVTISMKNVSLEDVRMKVKNVSLDLRAGEVIGLAGMEGSGQGMFIRACAGLVRPVGGRILNSKVRT